MSGGIRPCGRCGEIEPIERKARDGFPDLCRRCARRLSSAGELPPIRGRIVSRRECSRCLRVKPIHTAATDTHGDLCSSCYVSRVDAGELPGERCGGCGKQRYIRRRGRDGEPDLCGACYRAPEDTCTVCQRRRPCTYASTERAICIACQRRQNRRVCDECGQRRTIERRIDGLLICQPCWTRRLDARAICEACGQLARPAKSTRHRGLCEDCADDPLAAPCSRCDHRGRNIERGLCARCVLDDRLDALIATAAPGRADAMAAYLAALRGGSGPASVLNWLAHQQSAQWMRELLDGRLELSHDALDALGSQQSTRFLRAALVRHGALPERDDDQRRLTVTIRRQLERLEPGSDRQALARYAQWQITSELLHRKRRGKTRPLSIRTAQGKVSAAGHFLHHLQEHGLALAAVSQLHVDAWMAAGGPARHRLGPFLAWAHKGGLTAHLEAAQTSTGHALQLLDDAERLALVRWLLDDEQLDLRDRVAGSLVLLLAQPVTRIGQLTDAHIDDCNTGEVLLSLGRHPIPLPPKLGTLILRLRDEAPGLASTARTDEHWLFRGLRLDRPMHPERLRKRLARLGIHSRTGRVSAARPLAQQLPPQVLSDLLGYATRTAIGLSETYRAADSAYLAARRRSTLREPERRR